jgi:hypothetical protein
VAVVEEDFVETVVAVEDSVATVVVDFVVDAADLKPLKSSGKPQYLPHFL